MKYEQKGNAMGVCDHGSERGEKIPSIAGNSKPRNPIFRTPSDHIPKELDRSLKPILELARVLFGIARRSHEVPSRKGTVIIC